MAKSTHMYSHIHSNYLPYIYSSSTDILGLDCMTEGLNENTLTHICYRACRSHSVESLYVELLNTNGCICCIWRRWPCFKRLSWATFHSHERLTGPIKPASMSVRKAVIQIEPLCLPAQLSGEMMLHFNLISRECLLQSRTEAQKKRKLHVALKCASFFPQSQLLIVFSFKHLPLKRLPLP